MVGRGIDGYPWLRVLIGHRQWMVANSVGIIVSLSMVAGLRGHNGFHNHNGMFDYSFGLLYCMCRKERSICCYSFSSYFKLKALCHDAESIRSYRQCTFKRA